MMNSRGLRQEPWWTPTFTLNSSRMLQPTHSLLLAFSYMLCMSCTSYSLMPSLRRVHQITRLGTRSNAFSRSTQAMYSVLLTSGNFFVTGVQWIWRLRCCVQTWKQTACHQCALVVVGSSQPPSLEPLGSGLATCGLALVEGNDDTLLQ